MIIPHGRGIVSNRQTTSGNMQTSGTQFASSLTSGAMNIAYRYKMEKDETQLQEAINNTLKRKNEWKAKNLTREGKDAEGLTEDFISFNKELEEEVGSNLSNNAREKFSNWQNRDTEQEKLGVMLHQRKQDMFVKQSTFNEGLNIAEEAIRLDAKGNYRKAFEHVDMTLQNGLNAGVIREEEYESKRMDLYNKLRTETAKSYYTQDKHDFMKSGINELGLGETEKAYWQDKYNNDLEADKRERKALYSEEYRLIMGQVDDMNAQAVANKDTSHYHENAKRLDLMGYSEAATQLREKAGVYDKVIAFQDQNKNKSLLEEREAIQMLKVPEDLEGSSVEYKANLAIQKEYLKKEKLFKADPAEFVAPFVQGKNDEERASSRLALQEKQGVIPKDGFQVLTKTEKEYFKNTWETGDIQAKTAMIKESFKYGKYSPKVISELGVNKSLALAPMIDNEKDLELFVAGASEKEAVITDPKYKKSDYVDASKGSKFYGLLSKLQAKFPTDVDLPNKIQDIEKAMVGIGARKVDINAGADFFDSKFKTLDESDKMIYFPDTVDDDELSDRLDAKKAELTQSLGKTAIGRMAMRDAVWVNTPTGFTLADPKSGRSIEGSDIDHLDVDEVRKEMARKIKKDKENIYGQSLTYNRR